MTDDQQQTDGVGRPTLDAVPEDDRARVKLDRLASPASGPASVADGIDRQLDPRVIPLQRISGGIFTLVLAGMTFVGVLVTWAAGGVRWIGAAGLGVLWLMFHVMLAWHAYRWPAIDFRHTFYRIDTDGMEIRRGVFWRTVTNVPRSRVQHTDVSQGPIERSFGLGTLVIYTAGTDHAKVDLAGLDHATALRIREHLLPREEADAV